MPPPPLDPSEALALLEEAERHVREVKLRLERQRALVAEWREEAHLTDEAEGVSAQIETLLTRMEDVLTAQICHRDRLREEVQEIDSDEDQALLSFLYPAARGPG
jgi:hypothetical protein